MTPEEHDQVERRNTVAGVALLIVLVIAAMAVLSWYLSNNDPHLR